MTRPRLLTIAAPVVGKRKLPYSDSFTGPDGPVGSNWVYSSGIWTIASNKVAAAPTLGAEVLDDPGLESNYVGGVCEWTAVVGSPTCVQSADVHGGAKAQQFTATAQNDRQSFYFYAGVAKTWYLYSMWAKRTAGAAGNVQMRAEQVGGSTFGFGMRLTDAAYTQKKMSYYSPGVGNIFPWLAYEGGVAPFDTVIADDGSLKPITLAHMFMTRPPSQANVVVKADWTPSTLGHTHCGVVARLDSTSNPQNYLLGLVILDHNGYQWASLHKVVAGTLTTLVTNTDAAFAAGAYLEVRCSGTSVKLFYNNVQMGAEQVVADAGIVNNKIHGVFSTDGGNKLNRFFVGSA